MTLITRALLHVFAGTTVKLLLTLFTIFYAVAFVFFKDEEALLGLRVGGLILILIWFGAATLLEFKWLDYRRLAGLSLSMGVLTAASIVIERQLDGSREPAVLEVYQLIALSIMLLHFIVSLWILWVSIARFGGIFQKTETDKILARNRPVKNNRANIELNRWWPTMERAVTAILHRRRINAQEIVIGMGSHWLWHPLRWLQGIIGEALLYFGCRTEFTLFDRRPLITAQVETGVLHVAGAGGGKTATQVTNLAVSTTPKILVETQGNALEKDLPVLTWAGRRPYLFDPSLGEESSSINVLASIDPSATNFQNQILRMADYIIELDEKHPNHVLQYFAYELVAVVLAYIVIRAQKRSCAPDIALLERGVTDRKTLTKILEITARSGHPSFRNMAARSLDTINDRKRSYLEGSTKITAERLQFLSDPGKAALINGRTSNCLDPSEMLRRHDWDAILQIPQDELQTSGALLRLLILGLIQPRIQLTAEEAKRDRDSGVLICIDELAALGGSKILDETVVFFRQKNIRFYYNMQSIEQVERLYGQGTYAKWASSADVKIYSKISEAEFNSFVAPELGHTVRQRRLKVTEHGGGPNSLSKVWERVPFMEASELTQARGFTAIVLARAYSGKTIKLCVELPVYFNHTSINAFVERAKESFWKKPARTKLKSRWERFRFPVLPSASASRNARK